MRGLVHELNLTQHLIVLILRRVMQLLNFCFWFLYEYMESYSHTGQIYTPFKSFVMEQIRQKLITFEGKAKSSRVKALMKWWSKCISMVIAKTASRNVAFKSGKMMDALFQGQSMAHAPQSSLDPDLEGLASDSELYIFNQNDAYE